MNPQQTKDYFNNEYELVRQWNEVLSHEYFNKIVDKINNDIIVCDKNITNLCSLGTLDSSIKVTIEAATKERLKDLLRYFDYMRNQKLLLDEQLAKRKAINASF